MESKFRDVWMDGWVGWVDDWMVGWLDGWVEESVDLGWIELGGVFLKCYVIFEDFFIVGCIGSV